MAHSPSPYLWYSSYRGAVYPIQLHADPAVLGRKTQHVKSLVEVAAEKIVQDSAMTSAALSIVPKPLCEPMMKEALLKNREIAIGCIIASWPGPVLVLRDLVPELFTSVHLLYNKEYHGDVVKQGLRYTTSLAHTFVEALKSKAHTKLKFLDLTGFPTAEVMVYFLATHCMLAHNEVRHEAIRSIFEQALQQSNDTEVSRDVEPMEPMEHSLPQDCSVVVKLDAFLTSEATHSELCKALKVSSFHNRKLCIIISTLGMTCLGQPRISLLLKQLQPQFLTGLQLQYNALTAHDFVKMAPALKTLVNLESLDLSCNTIYFYQHETACSVAAQVFEAMPRLQRLDLGHCRIKTRLRRLLETIARPLTFLRLAGCSLTVTDLVYLSHSIHRTQLTELDLSENNLSQCDRQLREVLAGSHRTLCVLELEDCNLNDSNVHSLLPSLSHLSSLMFINLSQNRLTQNCQMSLVATLAELVSLQVIKASYATECYLEGEEEQCQAAALMELNQISNRSSVQSVRLKPLILSMTQLERVLQPV